METVASDQTREIVRENLNRIRLITVAGPLLCNKSQASRVLRVLQTRKQWGIDPPLVMLAVHDDDEADAAERFQAGPASHLARFTVKRQDGHNQTVGNAVELFRSRACISRIAVARERRTSSARFLAGKERRVANGLVRWCGAKMGRSRKDS